jgi:hypothetical protein
MNVVDRIRKLLQPEGRTALQKLRDLLGLRVDPCNGCSHFGTICEDGVFTKQHEACWHTSALHFEKTRRRLARLHGECKHRASTDVPEVKP